MEPDFTLADLRGLIFSIPLPTASCAASSNTRLGVCFDGRLLTEEEDEVTLSELGVLDAPVVVVLAVRHEDPPTYPTSNRAPAKSNKSAQSPAPPPTASPDTAQPERSSSESAPPNIPPVTTTQPADAVCRICFGGPNENGAGRLISPCRCAGSMRYVHVSCLNEWRTASANPRSLYQCDQCGYQYSMQRTVYAKWLEDARLHRAAATLILLTATFACALVLGPLGIASHFYTLIDFHPSHLVYTGRLGRFVAAHWCWQLDWLVAGLLGPGFAGLSVSLLEAYRLNRHVNNSWIVMLIAMFAQGGTRATRVLIAGGFCYSVKVRPLFRYGQAHPFALRARGTAADELGLVAGSP